MQDSFVDIPVEMRIQDTRILVMTLLRFLLLAIHNKICTKSLERNFTQLVEPC